MVAKNNYFAKKVVILWSKEISKISLIWDMSLNKIRQIGCKSTSKYAYLVYNLH